LQRLWRLFHFILWKLKDLVQDFAEAIFFVVFPALLLLTLGLILFFLRWDDFTSNIGFCWSVTWQAELMALTIITTFFGLNVRPSRSFIVMLVLQMALILTFAAMYRGYGLMYAGAEVPKLPDGTIRPVHPGTNALYFSIVTWTTLGYGDFTPLPEMRMIAAIEALTGFVFFGVIVGLATQAVGNLGRDDVDT
jgi:Ion channel